MTEFVRDFDSFIFGVGAGLVLSVILYTIIDVLQKLRKARTAPEPSGPISGPKSD
jgi:hypothetical protein